jgi:hypothetical protein
MRGKELQASLGKKNEAKTKPEIKNKTRKHQAKKRLHTQ